VALVLETHGTARGVDIAEILFRAAYPPALRINWHLAHCLNHGEDVDEAYRHVKGRIGHVHWNIAEEQVERVHLHRQFQLLSEEGYDGYCSVEVINPPDSLKVLADHAAAWQELTA
jgi:sugar phosphate isomerase/epimerase